MYVSHENHAIVGIIWSTHKPHGHLDTEIAHTKANIALCEGTPERLYLVKIGKICAVVRIGWDVGVVCTRTVTWLLAERQLSPIKQA